MQSILEHVNWKLIRDVESLVCSLKKAQIPTELHHYRDLVLEICEDVEQRAQRNLSRIELLDQVDIIEDILSETQIAMQLRRSLSSILAPPVLRASQRDRLSLLIIN